MTGRCTRRPVAPLLVAAGLVLSLGACSRSPAPQDAADPYAGGTSYPWSDRLDPPGPDPYAGDRSYPWSGVRTAGGPYAPQGLTAGDNALSDLDWTSATNAWGPAERDRSNGEQAGGDGRPLTIGGQTFARGLGVHARSELSYAVSGWCSAFTAQVGVDDEVGDRGSVVFQVYGDDRLLYDSGVLRGTDTARAVSVDLRGVQTLRLVVTDGGNGISYDHADWASAQVACPTRPFVGQEALSGHPWSQAQSAWGPVELNRSNGEQRQGDGQPLTLGGTVYPSGLGVHAASVLEYALGGRCSQFSVVQGVDDEVGDRGSVVFQVYGDGVKRDESPVLRGSDPGRPVTLDVSGVQTLSLRVSDAGDGRSHDHADWADARVSCAADADTTPPNTFVYSALASQPYNVAEAQGRALNGRLYTFGGFDSLKGCCTPTDRAYVYDPAARTWAALTPLPERGVTHAGMTTDGASVYYAGGYIANSAWNGQVFGTRAVWRYRPATNSYVRLPDLPVERAAGQLEYLNGKLHYFGGTNLARTQDTADHYVLDLTGGASSWAVAAPLPNPRNHLGSAVLNGRIYAVGGQRGHDQASVTQNTLNAYDPATDRWSTLAPLPVARGHISSATFVLAGRVVVAGGERSYGNFTADVSAYDPATNTWAALTPLPAARASGVAAALEDGFVYTSGNWTRTGWLASPQAP